jgi:hypothetical protein
MAIVRDRILNIRISEKEHLAVTQLADEEGVAVSVLVRSWIRLKAEDFFHAPPAKTKSPPAPAVKAKKPIRRNARRKSQ